MNRMEYLDIFIQIGKLLDKGERFMSELLLMESSVYLLFPRSLYFMKTFIMTYTFKTLKRLLIICLEVECLSSVSICYI